MKISPKAVVEPYTVCRAAAVAGSDMVGFPSLGRLLPAGGNPSWGQVGRLIQACGKVVGMGHGRPWALSFLMAELLYFSLFFFFDELFISWKMQLRGQLMQFLSSGLFHQTAQVKMKILQYWFLITSGKGKGEIHKGCLEQEQVEGALSFCQAVQQVGDVE